MIDTGGTPAPNRPTEISWDDPIDLLAALLPATYEYARTVTANPGLRLTFVLNALVALVPLDTAGTIVSVRTIVARKSLITRVAFRTDRAVQTVGPIITGQTLGTLNALSTLSTGIALHSGITLNARIALRSLWSTDGTDIGPLATVPCGNISYRYAAIIAKRTYC